MLLRKLIRQGKEDHDKAYFGIDFSAFMAEIKRTREVAYFTRSSSPQRESELNERSMTMNVFDNLIRPGGHWQNNDLPVRLEFFLRKRVQKLCKGTVSTEKIIIGFSIVIGLFSVSKASLLRQGP